MTGPQLPPGGLREPDTGPALHFVKASWRRLPLTAQLGAIGVLVALVWFFLARYTADQVAEAARARTQRLQELHAAELIATRMLTSVTAMSNAVRGYAITGDGLLEQRYRRYRRSFDTDVALLDAQAGANPSIRLALRRLVDATARFDRDVAIPAFTTRDAPAARIRASVAAIDAIRYAHAQLMREVRDEVIQTEFEEETAAAGAEWETFLIRTAAVATFILLLSLLMRVVARALRQVIVAAQALDAGHYADARLPAAHRAPNREMATLTATFEHLAHSIETRERQLQEDIIKLKELEALKTDFVSTVSHELRTPLTSMRGALGLLLGGAGGDLSAKGRELLRIALTNTDRLIRLINDILDIEKIDAGHVNLRRDRLRLKPLLESTLAALEGLGRDAEVKLTIVRADDVEVIGDADRLTQVFTNLVSNAVKFAPRGTAVEVSIAADAPDVTVAVRDHGPGIPPEFRSRIFGRFQQAGGYESRRSGGTGLGLSIAKAITELHAGRIWFDEAPGGGTMFAVSLPIAPRPQGAGDERAAVLIVEDDDSMRDVLCAMLEPFARPVPVVDAEAALRVLEEAKVRAIILDTGLPGMDGLAFARRLRSDPRYRTLSILLYSASDFTPQDLKDSGIRIADAFVKTRDTESSLVERVRRELQGQT